MSQSNSQSIEQVLFERMGISVEDAVATAADAVDEKISAAVGSGVDVDARIDSLSHLLERLTEPATVAALVELCESLPQLAQLARLANGLPNIVAMLGDVLDDYQQRCNAAGIDVEKAIVNGIHATLWLGSQVDNEHLKRIGNLLGSDILDPHALNLVDNAAKSLTAAQEGICESPQKNRVGMFGLLSALRKPDIQRSLGFAIQFGECFGKNLEPDKTKAARSVG